MMPFLISHNKFVKSFHINLHFIPHKYFWNLHKFLYLLCVLYSQKIWRGIKFCGLADQPANRQLKVHKIKSLILDCTHAMRSCITLVGVVFGLLTVYMDNSSTCRAFSLEKHYTSRRYLPGYVSNYSTVSKYCRRGFLSTYFVISAYFFPYLLLVNRRNPLVLRLWQLWLSLESHL